VRRRAVLRPCWAGEEAEGAEGVAGVEEDGAGGDAAGVAGGGTDGEEGDGAGGDAARAGRTAAARTGSAAAGWSRWPAAWSAPTSRPETPRCSGSGGGRCLAKTEP